MDTASRIGEAREGSQRDVWTVAASGGAAVAVTNDAATDWNPVWSPDGRWMFFSSNRGGSMNLWRVRINEVSGAVLAARRRRRRPAGMRAFRAAARPMRTSPLTGTSSRSNSTRGAESPQVSQAPLPKAPDRRSFPTYPRTGVGCRGLPRARGEDVFVMRSDGTGFRKLTDDAHRDREPKWSPDGKKVGFYSDRSGEFQLWTVNADGAGLRQPTNSVVIITTRLVAGRHRVAARTPPRAETPGRVLVVDVGTSWSDQIPDALQFSMLDGVAVVPNRGRRMDDSWH